jgi:hypothetical protein
MASTPDEPLFSDDFLKHFCRLTPNKRALPLRVATLLIEARKSGRDDVVTRLEQALDRLEGHAWN